METQHEFKKEEITNFFSCNLKRKEKKNQLIGDF
jgi:hypothetical protein